MILRLNVTRINLVPPSELSDQHLFAEFREIKMVPKSLIRSLRSKTMVEVLNKIPDNFTLGKGHVTFFYNKGKFLRERFEQIKDELTKRGVRYNPDSVFDIDGVMEIDEFNGSYIPTEEALQIIRERISQRIEMKPEWYRYYGKNVYY